MIPLFVDCSQKQIVIFGGGEVASRKAAYFSPEADVLVVSRSFSRQIRALPVRRMNLDLRSAADEEIAALIRPAFLVVATLPAPALNNRIGDLCRAGNILFNNAAGSAGDVFIPSVAEGEHYCLAISTRGNSPAVARYVREHFGERFPALDEMVSLQHDLREDLKRAEPSPARRHAILRRVLEDITVWEELGKDPAAARRRVEERYLHG